MRLCNSNHCCLCVSISAAYQCAEPITDLDVVDSVNDMQVNGLTSLEVVRQRQAKRAQQHFGLPAQSQGALSHQPQAAGLIQPSRFPQAPSRIQKVAQNQATGHQQPDLGGTASVLAEGTMVEGPRAVQEPGQPQQRLDPAQQARAKLEAIRNELGEV